MMASMNLLKKDPDPRSSQLSVESQIKYSRL